MNKLILDQKAAAGAAGFFILLISCLFIGAFIYVIMTPLFDFLNQQAISLYAGSMSKYYPETIQTSTVFIFQIVEYSIVVFFLFVVGYYVKGYIQPWTR